jgi:glycosyltransferase involved in cell wall biosynthesis
MSDSTDTLDLDVVVPVFNEQETLEVSIIALYKFLTTSMRENWRITIADNASTDGTLALAEGLAERLPKVVVVHLAEKGRGRALKQVWSASPARVLAYVDEDLSTDLSALGPLVAPLFSGHSDLAIGTRLDPASRVTRAGKREFISRSYNLLLRRTMGVTFSDAQCGFKAIRRDVALRLLPLVEDNGWFFDTELLLLAERNGLRIHEVPVDWVDDVDSRVHVLSTALGDLKGTARMALRFATGRGRVDLGPDARVPLANDFGRRFVSFSLIGAASTAMSLALFLSMHDAIGPIGANIVAGTATFVANAWANARYTEHRARPRWARSVAFYIGSLVSTSVALVLVGAVTTSLAAQVAVLIMTWSLAAVTRFVVIGGSR